MEYLIAGLLIIDIVLTFAGKLSIDVNIKYPEPQPETYSNLEELQKKYDDEYEKEQKDFVDSAQAVQNLFLGDDEIPKEAN